MIAVAHDRRLIVRQVICETPETKSFSLDFEGEPLHFIAGQFVNVTAEIPDHGRVRRAYSIASSPLDGELLLTVKRMEDGLLSTYLCDKVREGDSLHIRGPYGRFTLNEDAPRASFIAGGSGIVPFRSMWRYIRQRGVSTKFSLLYASKSRRFVIYRDEIDALSAEGHRIVHTFTRNDDLAWGGYSRRIDRAMLAESVPELDQNVFYVCGPHALCACVQGLLLDLGIEKQRIRTEKYE